MIKDRKYLGTFEVRCPDGELVKISHYVEAQTSDAPNSRSRII